MGILFLLLLLWVASGVLAVHLSIKYDNKTQVNTTKELADAAIVGLYGPISLYKVLQEIDAPLPWNKK